MRLTQQQLETPFYLRDKEPDMPRFFTALAVVVLLGTLVYGEQRSRDPKKEQVICEKLAAVAPGALEKFQRATVAMDNRDYAQAAQLYREG